MWFTVAVSDFLQAMLIIAWNPSGSVTAFFYPDVFRSVLSIFLSAALLNFFQGIAWILKYSCKFHFIQVSHFLSTILQRLVYMICSYVTLVHLMFFHDFLNFPASLDILLSWKAWGSMPFNQIFRQLLKFAVATAWIIILPVSYSSTVQNPTGLVKYFSNWAGNWKNQPLYNYAIVIYMMPNVLAALLFMLPRLRRSIERSNSHVFVFLMWWAQASIPLCFSFPLICDVRQGLMIFFV